MAGDGFTLRAGFRAALAAFRRGRFWPEEVGFVFPRSILRSIGEAVVSVYAACASIAGDVNGLKKSSPSP